MADPRVFDKKLDNPDCLRYVPAIIPEVVVLTIGLAEAQERLGSLIELAEEGEVVCIMRRGRQVAQITSLDIRAGTQKPAARAATPEPQALA